MYFENCGFNLIKALSTRPLVLSCIIEQILREDPTTRDLVVFEVKTVRKDSMAHDIISFHHKRMRLQATRQDLREALMEKKR